MMDDGEQFELGERVYVFGERGTVTQLGLGDGDQVLLVVLDSGGNRLVTSRIVSR